MKKRWRWNNEAVERSDLDSILDKVVRDLFGRGDRPKHRRSGAARPPAKRRRQSFALEAIEPRLLLSADLSYGSPNPLHHAFTLHATRPNTVSLLDNANNNNVVDTKTLSDGAVTIERAGGSVAQAAFGDTIHIALDTFSSLDTNASGIGSGGLNITFTGGDQRVFQDNVSLEGTPAGTLGFGLSILSDSKITASAHADFTGNLTLDSEVTASKDPLVN